MGSRTRANEANEHGQSSMTEEEMFEIFTMILPEHDMMKNGYQAWVSLAPELKTALENRLDHVATTAATKAYSGKDIHLYRGYCMGRILLQVYHQWDSIQNTLGAPGIQSGLCSVPKRLDMDISVMMKCLQEQLQVVFHERERERPQRKHTFLSRLRVKLGLFSKKSAASATLKPKLSKLAASKLANKTHQARMSLSESAMMGQSSFISDDFDLHASDALHDDHWQRAQELFDLFEVPTMADSGTGTNSDASYETEEASGRSASEYDHSPGDEDSNDDDPHAKMDQHLLRYMQAKRKFYQ